MSRFTTRVELHHADDKDYKTLHQAMEDEGFERTIMDTESGVIFNLPTAEYNLETDLDKFEVLNLAKVAAGKTKKKYWIIVTKSSGRVWSGLEEAK